MGPSSEQGHRRRRRTAGLLACGLLLGLAPAVADVATSAPAQARVADDVNDHKKQVDAQITQLKETLEGAKADFVDAAVKLTEAQANLADARTALATAQQQLATATALDVKLAGQLAFAQAEESKATAVLAQQSAAEEETRKALGDIARQTYVSNDASGLAVLLEAQSPDQLSEQLAYAGAALRVRNDAIDRLTVQQAESRAQADRLTAVRAQIAELKRQSAIVVAQRQAAQDAAAAAEAEVAAYVQQQQAAMTAIQGKIADERKRLDALSAQQAQLQAVLVARAKAARAAAAARGGGGSDTSADIPDSGGILMRPSTEPITSGFGMRYHPILHIWRMHTGTDFGDPCGTPVYAAADGTIISAGWAGGYGNRVVIDNGLVDGHDLATTYNHLSRIIQHSGSVDRGQLIAYSGTTGLSTGCHLHFETLVDGVYVNPMRFLS